MKRKSRIKQVKTGNMSRNTLIIIIIVVLFFIVGGYFLTKTMVDQMKEFSNNSGTSEGNYGDMLVDSSTGDASFLNPILAGDSASGDICGLVFNGLVKYDKDIKLVGDLAENWDISEDGLIITFHLRKNVEWHDGVPFTAKDVEFTFKKLTDPLTKSPYKSNYEIVKKAEVIDDYTFRVTYSEPFAPALESWGMGILPRHILEGKDINTADFNRNPMGTGPYKFKSWDAMQKITVDSYSGYFEGRPFIDKYMCRIIPDQSVQFLELKSGGLDTMVLTPDMFTNQTDSGDFKSKFNKYQYPAFMYTYMGFNLLSPLFKERKVRQAIAYAINKKDIIDNIMLGLGREATGPFPPESWAYNSRVESTPYDIEISKILLKAEGWVDSDNDGVLEKNGKKFEFMLMTNHGNKVRQQIAEIIQQQLKKIGIKVEVRIIAWSAFINEYVDKKKFDAVVLGWSLGRDPDCYDIFHSSKTKEKEYNFVSYNNPEIDKLLIEGRKTFDMEKRKRIYFKIHEMLAKDMPYVFLYVPDSLSAYDNRISGIKIAPAGISYNFIKWFVPEGRQKYRNVLQQ